MGILLFLTSLPVLGIIGHDIYLYQMNPSKGFEFTALGFLWTKYHPESYSQAIQTLDPETWNTLNTILTYKALYIALIPFGICLILTIIFKGIGRIKERKNSAAAAAKKWRRGGQL